MKKLLFLSSLLLWSAGAYAEAIDESTAHNVAQKFFEQKTVRLASTMHGATTLKLAAKTSAYYVYNRGVDGGYVVVAADDAAVPVLGYADSGHFAADSLPENLRWWLSEYEREIATLSTKATNANATTTTATTTERAAIAPLLTSQWGQGAPYNQQCPLVNDELCPTGCAATAAAQVMYYHKWPVKGRGSKSYKWTIDDVVQGTLSANFSQSTYDWTQMTDTYGSSSTETSKAAVAKLMSDVGIASEMQYAPEASGAYPYAVLSGLLTYFDYDKSGVLYFRDFYTRSTWEQMCYDELAAKRPIFYSGYTGDNAGHAFVCDGYRDGYFHINWGWDGMSNGYFRLSAFDPSQQGTGGSDAGYNFSQSVIFNVKPAQTGSGYTRYMGCNSTFTAKETSVSRTSSAHFEGDFTNFSMTTVSGTLGVKVTDESGNSSYIESGTSYGNMPSGVYEENFSISMSDFPTTDGVYIVTPAYFDDADNAWHDMPVLLSNTERYVIATVSGSTIALASPSTDGRLKLSDFAIEGATYAGKTLRATAKFTAQTDYYYGSVYAFLFDKDLNDAYTWSSPCLLDIAKGDTQTLNFSLTLPDTVADCCLLLMLDDGTFYGYIPFSISAAPAGDLAFGVAEAFAVENSDNVSADDFHFTAVVTCKSGYYDGSLYALIYPSGNTNSYVCYLSKPDFIISAGEQRTVEFRGTLSGVEVGDEYIAVLCYLADDGYVYQIYDEENSWYGAVFTIGSLTPVKSVTVAETQPHAIRIYNTAGVLIDSQYADTADLSRLAPGLYIVHEGNTVRKVVKK